MSMRSHALFWLAVLAGTLIFLGALGGILLPFVVALGLAYLLDPVVDRMETWGLGRMTATIIVIVLVCLLGVAAFLLMIPLLLDQAVGFAQRLPDLAARLREMALNLSAGPIGQYLENSGTDVTGTIKDVSATLLGILGDVAKRVWASGLALFNLVSLILITPFVAFYVLLDWDRMVAKIDGWLPRRHADTIRRIAHDIDDVLAGFIRGQGTVCLILGVFYMLGLSIVGLDYGLIIGFVAGLLTFIPFVGAAVGLLMSVGVALVQFWPDYLMIGAVAAIFFAGQALEGNFLSPKLVGDHVQLHPVWIIFALLAFGYLFGLVGTLIAVPAAAVIGVLARFGVATYLQSDLYEGRQGRDGET
ncbi:AI-2E family transporter [Futiania mangrovi]|uniref:AI-2E family transporter n=1 Tax=Futiania mangrovi TaxID=2959716 RepID=A0A9J6P9R1_9PROT|nr:AI-2E family transporter [Futiania mangrovii]MCP1335661.1 AI-2E family transporter [Futiania mangrovii]